VRTTKQRLTCGNASHLHERPRFKEVFQALLRTGVGEVQLCTSPLLRT
jgi:hypothetical protein